MCRHDQPGHANGHETFNFNISDNEYNIGNHIINNVTDNSSGDNIADNVANDATDNIANNIANNVANNIANAIINNIASNIVDIIADDSQSSATSSVQQFHPTSSETHFPPTLASSPLFAFSPIIATASAIDTAFQGVDRVLSLHEHGSYVPFLIIEDLDSHGDTAQEHADYHPAVFLQAWRHDGSIYIDREVTTSRTSSREIELGLSATNITGLAAISSIGDVDIDDGHTVVGTAGSHN